MESGAPPSAGLYNFLGWLDVNKKRVAIGIVIVAILGLIAGFVVWQQSEAKYAAAESVSSIRIPFGAENPAPGTAEAYLKVAQEHPKTPAAQQGLLRAGTIYFQSGDYAKAQEQFNKLVSSYPESALVPQARYGIAAALDGQGNTQEAITKFNDFVRSYPNDAASEDARLNLARLYQKAGKPTEAIATLSAITNAAPFSPLGGEVQERLKAIYAKNPSLAPAPAPRIQQPQTLPLPMQVTPAVKPADTNTGAAAPKIILSNPNQNQPGK